MSCSFAPQVILVGDFNVAMTHADVHPSVSLEASYGSEELEIMHSLTRDYVDAWRSLHPEVLDQFTVWDERTAARTVNKVGRFGKVVRKAALAIRLAKYRYESHPCIFSYFFQIKVCATHVFIFIFSNRGPSNYRLLFNPPKAHLPLSGWIL